MDLLDRMLGFDAWTTDQYLAIAATLTDDQLDQEFNLGRASARETLAHMIQAMSLWTTLMAGTRLAERPAPIAERAPANLRAIHSEVAAAFAAQARAAVAAGRLDATFLDHYQYPKSYGGTILQVLNHNSQHRAELRHMFVRLGVQDLGDGDPQEWEYAAGLVPLAGDDGAAPA